MNKQSPNSIDQDRRRLVGTAVLGVAAAPLGFAEATQAQKMPGQAPTRAGAATFARMQQVRAGVLDIGYAEDGPADGAPVVLLHGWPYDIHSYVDVAPQLAAAGYRVLVPHLRGYGTTRFLSPDTPRNGQPAALASDAVAFMDALDIKRAVFGGFDWGARTAGIVAALWPERVKALVSVSGYLISSQKAAQAPLPPEAELQWWYQFYFATDRGRAGYEKNTHAFAKLIWKLASPKWAFDDATFDRSAKSFENPDHVDVVIHNYRWRLGLAKGESKYDDVEAKLAATPAIMVPTITLEGDANGAPHPPPESTPNASPASMNTVCSRAVSATIRRRKRRVRSFRRSSMPIVFEGKPSRSP